MIRPSKREEIPSLIRLAEETGLFPPEHLEALQEMLAGFFESEEEQDGIWLTDDDGDVAGLAFCEPEMMTSGTWNLRLIAVAPTRQGAGRGGELLEHVERDLRGRQARLLIVDTSGTEEFAPVRAFYSKYGYAEESRIRDFFEEGDDKVTFTKHL